MTYDLVFKYFPYLEFLLDFVRSYPILPAMKRHLISNGVTGAGASLASGDTEKPAPPPRPLSTNGKVVLALKEAILGGTYPPETMLPAEEVLVRQLEVSRVALREGIKQLEAMGWLHIERGNGTRVTQPDFRLIEPTVDYLARFEIVHFADVHQLRSLIEVQTAQDLARTRPAGLVDKLRAANQRIAARHDQPAGYVDADVAFHDVLVAAAPNPLFSRLLDGFRKYMLLSRRQSFSGPEAVLEAVKAHDLIIDAIARGDVPGARAAMEGHLHTTAQQLKI